MKHVPYDIDKLKAAVAESVTIHDVLRKIGKKLTGGNHKHVKSKIQKLGLDISHFTGRASNYVSVNKLRPEDVLVYDRLNGLRTKHSILKRAMLASGFEYRCMADGCVVGSTWNGKPLNLQIDHINGDCIDNRKENLRFICANCHTQTPTHSTKKII